MKKKTILGIVVASILVLCIIMVCIMWKSKADAIVFVEDNVIEYGSKIASEELVKQSKGEILEYPKLNTKKLGKQKLTYKVKYSFGSKAITHEVIIKDTQKPIIDLKQEKITILQGDSFDPEENIKGVKDVVDGALNKAKETVPGSYTVSSKVDIDTIGTYEVEIVAHDIHNNRSTKKYKVIVEEKSSNPTEYGNENEAKPYYVNGILLVNKKHALPRTFGGYNEEANQALAKLQTAASLEGYDLPTLSAYRSYDYQAGLYNDYVARDGKEAADRYSAQPGKSEHQTGLAFDIGQLDDSFGETPAGKWLAQHAHEYGFIIRYPKGKEHITGYMYEPWHVRYLGIDTATSVYQSGLTLEEYLNDY